MNDCERHLPCKLVRNPVRADEVTLEHSQHGGFIVKYGDDIIGSIGDRSFPTRNGVRHELWSAFGGGSHLGDSHVRADALAEVVRNANATSFHWRLALHG